MSERLAAGRVFGLGWKTGFVCGALVGLQEGLSAALVTYPQVGNIQLTSLLGLIQVFSVPTLFDALAGGLAIGLLALLLRRLPLRRLEPLFADEERLAPLLAGLAAGSGLYFYAVSKILPVLALSRILRPERLFDLGRFLVLALLAGWAVSALVRSLRGRPAWPAAALALLISAVLATPHLLWFWRNRMKDRPEDWTLRAILLGMVLLALFLALLLRPLLRRALARGHGALLHGAVLAALVLCSLLPFFHRPGKEAHAASPYRAGRHTNLLLLTVDTLRADHLSCYDAGAPPTPNFDRLAREGVRFSRTQSQSPWTLPSLCSLMTSLYPTAQGVVEAKNRLDPQRVTLADALAGAGYLTQGVVANGWLVENYGLHQGFLDYDHVWAESYADWWAGMIWLRVGRRFFVPDLLAPPNSEDSAELVGRALNFLRRHREDDFFLWVHVIDPHDPYTPLGRYSAEAGLNYEGKLPRRSSGLVNFLRRGMKFTTEDRRHMESLYDLEVRYVDEQLGKLLDGLEELGLAGRTLVVFTSDHGEEFWEHENVGHGHTLHDELTHVPLIFRLPDGVAAARRTVGTQVRLLDVAPTVLDILGAGRMPDAEGESLLPLMLGEDEGQDRTSFAEALIYAGEKKSLDNGRYRFILSDNSAREELYDMASDPEESVNLVKALPEVRMQLKGELREHLRRQRELFDSLPRSEEGNEAVVDEALSERLRALGYIQ